MYPRIKLGIALPNGRSNTSFYIPKRIVSNIREQNIGKIDPKLYVDFDEDEYYEITEEHIGRVWFTVCYLSSTSNLELTLLKARNLYNRSRRYTIQQCSSFVIVEIAPFFKSKAIQTKVRKNTSDPDYNEVFNFEISPLLLRKCALHFMIVDMCDYKHQKVIGHAYYPLKELPKQHDTVMSIWRNLIANPRLLESRIASGLIHLALHHFENVERITVTIYEVEHVADADVGSDIFIKFKQFLGEHKLETKRTSNMRIEENKKMIFNESFQFKVNRKDSNNTTIELNVMLIGNHGNKDRQIGTLRLSANGTDEAGELWLEMLESSTTVTKWLAILTAD